MLISTMLHQCLQKEGINEYERGCGNFEPNVSFVVLNTELVKDFLKEIEITSHFLVLKN